MDMDIKDLQDKLRDILPKKRYYHTLGVQYTCASLAMRYGLDINKAQVSGLLHDCAKYMKSSQILEKCKELNMTISKTEEEHPHLLHGRLGAYYAKTIYGVDDLEILKAIEYHTTGHPDMSLLEKILFVSDYIEPGRKIVWGLEATRDAAFVDIDRAVVLKIESVLKYLNDNDFFIDNITKETYESYKEMLINE